MSLNKGSKWMALLQKPNPKKFSGPAASIQGLYYYHLLFHLDLDVPWTQNPHPCGALPNNDLFGYVTVVPFHYFAVFVLLSLYCDILILSLLGTYYKQEILTSIALASSCPKKGSESHTGQHRLCTVFDQIWYLKTVILFQLKYRRYWLVSDYF